MIDRQKASPRFRSVRFFITALFRKQFHLNFTNSLAEIAKLLSDSLLLDSSILCFHVTSLFSKTKNPSAALVLSDVRPSNDLTFCNVSARQGFSIC